MPALIWSAHHRSIRCPNGHLYPLKAKDGKMQRDHQSVQGHEFFRCDLCVPSTYWFVVFTTTPDRHAMCYAIAESCWREWQDNPSDTSLSTLEMLYLIRDPEGRSHNPTYRPD